MPFEKGKPRAAGAGRKPGTPNKKRNIMEICEGLNFDPFLELAKIASNAIHERQFEALKELCQYIEPKKKALEHSSDAEKGFRIILEDYRSKT